ncbi:transposase [Streptomyces sp. NBC_01210]|nr:transposase [Streptomyces sp. NBC_01210]
MLAGLFPDEWPPQRNLDFLAQHQVYDNLLRHPEANGAWDCTQKPSRTSARQSVDIATAITGWISGEPIPRLATTGRHLRHGVDTAQVLAPQRRRYLPARGKKPGRPPTWTWRQLINGIRSRIGTGAPWRDVPQRYGPGDRAYDLFRRWQRDDTWKRILEQLQAVADAKGRITWDVSVDSTIARAHQHAAGARKSAGPAAADHRSSTSPTTTSATRWSVGSTA